VTSSRILAVARLLKSVARRDIDPTVALEAWPTPIDEEDDPLIASAWHELTHYENDVDIRTKDPKHDKRRRNDLYRRACEILTKHQGD
jgi:hypothetical protein